MSRFHRKGARRRSALRVSSVASAAKSFYNQNIIILPTEADMSRWVVLTKPGLKAGKGGEETPSGPLERIARYVPAEIISPYTMLFAAFVSLVKGRITAEYWPLVPAALMFLFFIATIAYVWRETSGAVRRVHLIVSPLAFLAWAYPISSALLGDWFDGIVALSAQAIVICLSIALWREPG
jgi:hypothetical protein